MNDIIEAIKKLIEYNMDDELCKDTLSGTEAIECAHIVVVDDARSFNTEELVDELKSDYADEEEWGFLKESASCPTPRIIVDKDEVKKILDEVSKCKNIKISQSAKNRQFFKDYGITKRDVYAILRQLEVGDYSYTLVSNHEFHEGALLGVFITSKHFDLIDKSIDGVILYIKLEYTDVGVICLVSMHPSKHEGAHPYSEVIS